MNIISLTHTIYFILLMTITCNKFVNQPQSHDSPTLHVKEINDIHLLKNYLKEKKKAIVEFYLPTCPHCVEFAPKYETLATIYKDSIPFVKVDCSDPRNYMSIVKLRSFPSLFIYDEGKLFQYYGLYEVEQIHQFIETAYYFKCHKLETTEQLTNFVSENKENYYILGIMNSEAGNEPLDTFVKLNSDMRHLVQNKCYYYIDASKKDTAMSEETNNVFIHNLSIRENFVVSYDTKNFHVFDKISNLNLLFPKESFDFEKIYSKVLKSYEKFLINKLYPPWENLEEDMFHTVLARNKKYMIFSALPKDKKMIKNLMEQFIIMKPDSAEFDCTILFLEMNEEGKSSKFADMVEKTEIALYDTHYNLEILFEEEEMFNVEKIIIAMEEKNQKLNEERNNSMIRSSSVSNESHGNYVTAKIVEKLEGESSNSSDSSDSSHLPVREEGKTEKEDFTTVNVTKIQTEENTLEEKFLTELGAKNITNIPTFHKNKIKKEDKSIFVWILYISIYSVIYIVIYQKYFSHITSTSDMAKDN